MEKEEVYIEDNTNIVKADNLFFQLLITKGSANISVKRENDLIAIINTREISHLSDLFNTAKNMNNIEIGDYVVSDDKTLIIDVNWIDLENGIFQGEILYSKNKIDKKDSPYWGLFSFKPLK